MALEKLFHAEVQFADFALNRTRADLFRVTLWRVVVPIDQMLLAQTLYLLQRVAANRDGLLSALSVLRLKEQEMVRFN